MDTLNLSSKNFSKKQRILVFGSYNQDLSWMVDHFPVPGETLNGSFLMTSGGKGSNQAIAVHKAGGDVFFIGAIGKDLFGEKAQLYLKEQGLPHQLIQKDAYTGTAGIFVNQLGDNEIIVNAGANHLLKNDDIFDEKLSDFGWVVCSLETHLNETVKLFTRAQSLGIVTILNPAPNHIYIPHELFGKVDIIIPNESEFISLALQLEPKFDGRQLKTALDNLQLFPLHQACRIFGIPYVLITLGERGVFLSTPDTYQVFPTFKVSVIDTTGAGDAFIGGFVTALSKNQGHVAAAIRFANATAALTVTKRGAAASMPSEQEIKNLLLND